MSNPCNATKLSECVCGSCEIPITYQKPRPLATPDQGNRTSELDAIEVEIVLPNGNSVIGPLDPEAKAALQRLISQEATKARDSEQNTLFAILRHLKINHDAKAIMKVRREWDESAERRRLDALQGGTKG